MANKHLAPAGWLALAALTFGLGWALRSTTQTSGSGTSKRSPQIEQRGGDGGSLSALSSAKRNQQRDAQGAEANSGARQFDASLIGGIGSSRELTAIEIEDLGAAYRKELDPIKKRLAFTKLMAGMTLDNAREIREQFAHLRPDDPAFRDFHYAFGQIGGAEAVLNGAETREPDMLATLAGFASSDPGAAMRWFASLDPQNKSYANQGYLKMGMVNGLADADTALATKFVLELTANGDKRASEMYQLVTSKVLQASGAVEAAAWASTLPAGDMRNTAMGRIAHDYARADPAAAAAWAEPILNSERNGHVAGAIGREWARRDGPAAVTWVQSLDHDALRAQAYRSSFESWVGSDPAAASQYITEMPSSPDRDSAISGLVSRHRWEDPVASIAWANDIADTGAREATLVQAAQAYLRRDHAAATQWLASSGLPADVQAKVTGGKR